MVGAVFRHLECFLNKQSRLDPLGDTSETKERCALINMYIQRKTHLIKINRQLSLLTIFIFFSFQCLAGECLNFLTHEQPISAEQMVEVQSNIELIRNQIIKIRTTSPDLLGSGNNAFIGIALQSTLLTQTSIESFSDYLRSFAATGFEKNSLEHLIIVSTAYRLHLFGSQQTEIISYFLDTKVDSRLGKLQSLFAIQTSLLMKHDLTAVSDFFYNFGKTPWAKRNSLYSLAAQASYMTGQKKQKVISFLRALPWIKSPLVVNLNEEKTRIVYDQNAHELSSTSRGLLNQLLFLLNTELGL